MRVLHFIHSEGVYGAERVLLYLAREQQRGHQVYIGSIRDPGTGVTEFEALASTFGLQVVRVRIPPRPTPLVVRSLLQVVRDVGADVLHSHGYKANILLGPVPRRVRGPMLTTLHGWTSASGLTRLRLYELLDRLCLRMMQLVVAVSDSMLSLPALRALPAIRKLVIENGIPSRDQRMADLSAQCAAQLPADLVEFVACNPTWIAIGRLAAEKDFTTLVEAFVAARSPGTGHQLLIVGEGPERSHLARRIAELKAAEYIRLAGYVEGADRFLQSAAGFVMSSLTEGLPLVLLEAMQWGVPIVATAVGAIPTLLEGGRCGLLVPPGSAAALSSALGSAMAGERAPLEQAALAAKAASDRFSSTRMATQYLAAYDSIREPHF